MVMWTQPQEHVAHRSGYPLRVENLRRVEESEAVVTVKEVFHDSFVLIGKQ
jgi:hypothetical protein